ncbi:MAG: DUF2157 domain-containing protein, partial [Nannocystaceae bacterium]
MGRARDLERWVSEGLINDTQADAIEKFETARGKDSGLRVFTRIGALAIAIGIISLVASNWDAIPAALKLLVDLAAGCALAWFAARELCNTPTPPTEDQSASLTIAWREAMIVMMFGWTTTSIALIGQVYQLGGHTLDAALTVLLVTTPLALFSRSRPFFVLWLLAWQAVIGAELIRLFDQHFSEIEYEVLASFTPAVLLFAGWVASRINERHAALSAAMKMLVITQWLVGASIGTFFFYGGAAVEPQYWWGGAALSAAAMLALGFLRLRVRTNLSPRARVSIVVTGILSWSCFYLPVTTGIVDAGFLNALSFCALWLAIA